MKIEFTKSPKGIPHPKDRDRVRVSRVGRPTHLRGYPEVGRGSGKVIIFGCPFDNASSYRRGSRFAPDAIRNALKEIENYSPYLHADLGDVSYRDTGNLRLPKTTLKALQKIEGKVKGILKKNDIPFAIGGEHLISLPVIRALHKKYPDLKVFYIDAHCDLRDIYLGLKFSHATVARRILELVGTRSFFHFGARSGEKGEFNFARKNGILGKFSPGALREVMRKTRGCPVYISLDLDIFDPGVFPGTCVPEPGGIRLPEFIGFIKKLRGGVNITGLDVVELSPPWDRSEASSFLAATVVRELLLIVKSRISPK